ncbi:unnamed protein product [Linum tenue]|uniref:Ataxin-2 C-terminal domain-containing protein n=1 Tax=Linum tenue TaxID=586396 RepID=A0AAV0MCW8_9ROSI|nr:unnamed protein product [Linum tenue]
MFAPMAYQAVEDFSDQWWSLIQPSTWFRDYWLQERYQDPQLTSSSPTTSISSTKADEEKEEELGMKWDMVSVGSTKWRKNDLNRSPRYAEKAAKIVNVKMSPRTIQQPR